MPVQDLLPLLVRSVQVIPPSTLVLMLPETSGEAASFCGGQWEEREVSAPPAVTF